MNGANRLQYRDDLFSDPRNWSFLAAYRLLTRDARPGDEPGRGPVFLRGCHRQENIVAQLADARPPRDGEPAELTVFWILHLGGVHTALPEYYNDWLVPGLAPAFADFIDLFNHSHLRLYPEAYAATAFPQAADDDRIAELLLGLNGFARGPEPHSDPRIYHFAAYARRTRPLAKLADLLSEYFDLQVDVGESPGVWVALNAEEAAYLGVPAVHEVGYRITLSKASWNDRLKHFHPEYGIAFERLVGLAAEYLGPHRPFDLEWILDADDPGPRSVDPEADDLDWSFWFDSDGARRGLVSAARCRRVLRTGER